MSDMSRTIDGFGTIALEGSEVRVGANEAILTIGVTSNVDKPADVVASVANGFNRVQHAMEVGKKIRVVITTNELRTKSDAIGAIAHFFEALDRALTRKFGNTDTKDDTLATAGAGRSPKDRYVNTSKDRGRRRR